MWPASIRVSGHIGHGTSFLGRVAVAYGVTEGAFMVTREAR